MFKEVSEEEEDDDDGEDDTGKGEVQTAGVVGAGEGFPAGG
jgi:hypothetical protein